MKAQQSQTAAAPQQPGPPPPPQQQQPPQQPSQQVEGGDELRGSAEIPGSQYPLEDEDAEDAEDLVDMGVEQLAQVGSTIAPAHPTFASELYPPATMACA